MMTRPNPMYERTDYYELAMYMERETERLKREGTKEEAVKSLVDMGLFTPDGRPKEHIVEDW